MFPRTYFVPRDGRLARISVQDHGGFEKVRAELALLQRIDRLVRAVQLGGSGALTLALPPAHLVELKAILDDARNPIVELMIQLIDREFGITHKGTTMSDAKDDAGSVNQPEEQPAAPADQPEGAPDSPPADAAPEASAEKDITASLDSALEAVEGALGDIVEQVGTAEDEAAEPTPAAQEPEPPVADDPSPPAAASSEPTEPSEPASSYIHQPVEQTVAEIEAGIRKLAGFLSTEVNGQWKEARGALSEVIDARQEAEQAQQQIISMLEETRRLQKECRTIRDEMDAVRNEAKLIREDTKKAKQRADHSAEAAELAADQVQKELENAQRVLADNVGE